MKVAVADRLQQVGEYYFSKKLEQIRQMRTQGLDVINLGIGSPDLSPSDAAKAAATEALSQDSTHAYASYRSTPELRQAIANFYAHTYQVTLDPVSQVLPLLGSKEGILYISLAFLNPGDTVLVPNPGYPAYSSVASLIGAKVIHYDLTEENGWLPDLAKIEAQDLSRLKLMWINYPHMPTGKTATAKAFSEWVAFAKKRNILICNDNPYGLVLNREAPTSLLRFDPGFENTLELNSLSKSFNMAGWRVGMLMSSREVIDAVLQVKSNVDSGMFLAVQAGASAALSAPDSWHEARNAVYRQRREVIWKIFDRLGFTYDRDQVGMFVWAKAPVSVSSVEAKIDEILLKNHVFITPGFIFGSNGLRYARASLCAPESVMQKALTRLGSGS